eukprot:TRINITY_DN22884_c0_g1_i1.p1 TRINITY_DN22884_c0_g1~~TRINITY_DN22884_c0_g1_i1.p1  ORF type:complete len:303 (+),score=59.16 TRINITY_DN22884_c0_g1_i1:46-954(+)
MGRGKANGKPSEPPAPKPSAPPAPEPTQEDEDDAKLDRLRGVLSKFEISVAEAGELAVLEDYNLILIADDSGSMSMRCQGGGGASFLNKRTRWDELRETVDEVLELGMCLVQRADIFFLNRAPIFNLRAGDPRIQESFSVPPNGSTPLTATLEKVVAHVGSSERPVLLLIATDGEPNEGISAFTNTVRSVISKKITTTTFKFQVLACTDDDDSVAWLDRFDKEFKEVDVTDDYYSERQQILKAGKVKVFTRFDWVAKILLGPIIAKFDSLDENSEVCLPVLFFMVVMFFVFHILFGMDGGEM